MKTFTIISPKDIEPDCIMIGNNKQFEYVYSGDDIEVKDEYHTMHELYQHSMALNIALCNCLDAMDPDGIEVFRSKLHYDGTMFGGYFIVMIILAGKQTSYHYKLEHWDKFKNIFTVEKCPYPYDGHTSQDVIERLMKL